MSRGGAGRRRPGLRTRMGVALVLTSLATLVVAALAMAPQLERRLENERLADLRGLVRTARPELRTVPDRDLHARSRELRLIAGRLEHRTGARVVIFGPDGHELVDTAAAPRRPAIADLPAVRARALRGRDGVAAGTLGGSAYAATTSREGGGHLTLVITKRLDDTRAAAGVVRDVLPLSIAAGLAVAAILAVLVSRSILRRLGRLADDARALRDEGLRHQVTVGGGDEIAVVARALEEMRARLVKEEASRQAFVATASHELRTPLASLQATLELLKEEVLAGRGDPAATAARADTALRQTHRLVALATDLLDLSRVDGEAELCPEPLELAELARTVAPEFADRLRGAGRPLLIRGGPALAVADPAATARVLRILLDNTSNYGEGAVTVSVATEPDAVLLAVGDEGPGLGDAEREQVFVRFARGSAADGKPGAGLGLAIARGLAHAQGGDLAAPATAAGAGAAFVMTLPPWRGRT